MADARGRLEALLQAHPDVWVVAVALVGFALVVVLAARRRRNGRPRAGEIWFADVPFEDGTGSKDRPVLVLTVSGRRCTVARFTSQDRGGRRDHARVPDGVPGLRKASWVDLRPVSLRRSALRRRAGDPGVPFAQWYADASLRTSSARRAPSP